MAKKKNKDRKRVLSLLTPMFVLLGAIVVYPICYSVYLSFQYYVLTDKRNRHFIGLENYLAVFRDATFWGALKNTLIWVAVTLLAQFITGMLLACLLNKPFRGRGIVRSVTLLPWVTPGVVISLMWRLIYDGGNLGILNDLMKKTGLIAQNVPWLASADTALGAQIVSMVWQGIPFFAIMILAAMQGIPTDLYEAAEVDGCSAWKKYWYVTWPFILPTVIITIFLRIVWIANNTELIYTMTQGGPGTSSLTVSVYTYMQAQKSMNFGYASALSIVMTVMLSGFMILYINLLDREDGI